MAIFSVGQAIKLITRAGSHLGSIALLHWDIDHAQILTVEKAVAYALIACALLALLWRNPIPPLIVASIALTEAIAAIYAGGFSHFQYTPLAWALRIAAPLALVLLLIKRLPERLRLHGADWFLRLGIATVFVIHGLEAYWLTPGFIDMILGTGNGIFNLDLSEAEAGYLLNIIALVDWLVAALVIIHPSLPLVSWLSFWGLVTALARPLSLGIMSYPEVLVRAPHFLAPLALYGLVKALCRAGQPITEKTGQTLPANTAPEQDSSA